MSRTESKKFIHWLTTVKNLSRSTAQNYSSARKNSNHAAHNAAQRYFEEFTGHLNSDANTKALLEENKTLQKRYDAVSELLANADAKINRLTRDYREYRKKAELAEEIIQNYERNYTKTATINARINSLTTDNGHLMDRVEYLQNQEAYAQVQIKELQESINDRRELVVITFSDGSVMGFPSNLKFMQIKETIQNQQLTGVSVITVDWEL